MRLGFGIDLLQIQNDLLDGVLAVAALDNFKAWPVQAEGAFRHEQHALLVVFAQAASGGQARAAVHLRVHAMVSRTNRRASSSPETEGLCRRIRHCVQANAIKQTSTGSMGWRYSIPGCVM